jgi:hypothetical protein
MRKTSIVVLVGVALFVVACTTQPATPPSTPVGGTTTATVTPTPPTQPALEASLPPLPAPGEWAAEITNPYFLFTPGKTFTYTGVKDGQPTVDTYVVTKKTKTILGVQATVILNTLRTGKTEIEGTEDWYAQDKAGNVWYLGEATQTFDKTGKVTGTLGSWEAGVSGARAGLFMPAAPKVGDSFYQEYLQGQAEDRYTVISLEGTITVPYGKFKGALVTEERTSLEPTIVSQKYYVKGVGQVYENDVKGSTEYAKLVSIK